MVHIAFIQASKANIAASNRDLKPWHPLTFKDKALTGISDTKSSSQQADFKSRISPTGSFMWYKIAQLL